jgi:hypothetical protein
VKEPNFIELFMSRYEVPPLYDMYLDRKGVFWMMEPPPPIPIYKVTQIVAEGQFLSAEQAAVLQRYQEHFHAQVIMFTETTNF